ncbi:MAG: DUF4440 domain-containing protein [Candidatus Glassbacteria bacterium]|nr:DUF4440 domain-containing protein [Candidatus Glassbacteria bacterium]
MSIRSGCMVLFATVIFGTTCQQPVREISPISAEDVAKIKALGPAYDQVSLAGNWDAYNEMFTEDVCIMMPAMPEIRGRTTFKNWIESIGITVTEHKLEFLEIDGYGDLAYARGIYTEAYTIEGVAEPITDAGKTLCILRKQPDGSWRFAYVCTNSSLPPVD